MLRPSHRLAAGAAGALITAALIATAPSARAGADEGVSLGVRAGRAIPYGDLVRGDSMRSNFDGMVPVWFDVGYRLGRQLEIGGYFQWGLLLVSDGICPPPVHCAAKNFRAGANVHWHFKWLVPGGAWGGPLDPWLGFGAGYESTFVQVDAAGARASQTDHGFEFANFQLGLDVAGAGPCRLGGFASFSVAEYERRTLSVATGSQDYALPDPTLHSWLMFGLRGRYDL